MYNDPMLDSREGFDEYTAAEYEAWLDERYYDDVTESKYEFEDDGQPDEYTEWQDYMGGDDWDHGQFDNDY
jgi:hypothetical protein